MQFPQSRFYMLYASLSKAHALCFVNIKTKKIHILNFSEMNVYFKNHNCFLLRVKFK